MFSFNTGRGRLALLLALAAAGCSRRSQPPPPQKKTAVQPKGAHSRSFDECESDSDCLDGLSCCEGVCIVGRCPSGPPGSSCPSSDSDTYRDSCDTDNCVCYPSLIRCACRGQCSESFQSEALLPCKDGLKNCNGELYCGRCPSPPAGSYLQSCPHCAVNKSSTVLSCSCQYEGDHCSSIDLQDSSIVNCFGVLRHACPAGSFMRSCHSCTFDGVNLACQCKGHGGDDVRATYPQALSCKEITNCSGSLICGPCPRGSYQASCTNCRLAPDRLSCDCRDLHGSNRSTSVPLPCASVTNCNGFLTCGACEPTPPGSYSRTCDKCAVNGSILCCDCKGAHGRAQTSCAPVPCRQGQMANCNGRLKCSPC